MPLSQQSVAITDVAEWQEGKMGRVTDYLAVEEPLEIQIASGQNPFEPLSVTMRTPGHDLELVAGFLLTEGVIDAPEQLREICRLAEPNSVKSNVVMATIENDGNSLDTARRNFTATSSCGVCGKASIDSLRRRDLRSPDPSFRITPDLLCTLSGKLRGDQEIFEKTGGLHAAGLFSATGELLLVREDIGRHNAVDKIVGWALLEKKLPLSDHVLMVSGRCGFEIAQKAIVAGIPMVASVSAPSSLAVKLSREMGLALVGFLRGSRFVVYSATDRVASGPSRPGDDDRPERSLKPSFNTPRESGVAR